MARGDLGRQKARAMPFSHGGNELKRSKVSQTGSLAGIRRTGE
jgi:hypothetical protein